MLETFRQGLSGSVGPAQVFLSGNTLQVEDYSRYHWTMFDPAVKREQHEKIFPEELKREFQLGAGLISQK